MEEERDMCRDNGNSEAPPNADERHDPPVPARFAVHDDDSANWVIRRISEARVYAARCAEWCRREQDRAKRVEDFFIRQYGSQLADWARRRIAQQGGRRKSVAVPAGTAGFRAQPERLVVEDVDAVILWAKSHCPEAVHITEHLLKSSLNEHVRQTGELPDRGVRIEPPRERFYVK